MTRYGVQHRRGRPSRWLPAVGVLMLVLLTGCAQLSASLETTQALREAGFRDAAAEAATRNGVTTLHASWSSDAAEPNGARRDIQRAARVAWARCPVDIDVLLVTAKGTSVPGTPDITRTFVRKELTASFGPQPDSVRAGSYEPDRATVVTWALVALLAVALVVALAAWLFRRGGRRRHEVWPGGGPYATPRPPPPGWAGASPPGWPAAPPARPAQPPGWSGPPMSTTPHDAAGQAELSTPSVPAPEPSPEPPYDIWERLPS